MGCSGSTSRAETKRNFSEDFPALPEEERNKYGPIFFLPEIDVKGFNGISSVFFSTTNEGLIEVTVVFEDEDRPEKWMDPIYDKIREHIFHRKDDVETFWIQLSENSTPEQVIFKGSWGGENQTWLEKTPKHLEGQFPASNFEIKDNRLVIWVVTWNHLFGAKNTNPTFKHVSFDNYPAFKGSREQLEDWFKKNR